MGSSCSILAGSRASVCSRGEVGRVNELQYSSRSRPVYSTTSGFRKKYFFPPASFSKRARENEGVAASFSNFDIEKR